MTSPTDLPWNVAMVTGAGGGLGKACAAALLGAGLTVVLTDFREEPAHDAVGELGGEGHAWAYRMDVRDPDSVAGVVGEVWDRHGPVDVLVNAAGLYPSDPLLEMSADAWRRVIDTNLTGPHLCVQAVSRRLAAAHRHGVIVNISSGAAYRARPGAAHYCTSKAGLNMLTRAEALELSAYGIRVNAVAPGFVSVDSPVNPLSEEYVAAITRDIPLRRGGEPADIADAVLFLCSERADWITGAVLSVDGGSSAGTLALPLSAAGREG